MADSEKVKSILGSTHYDIDFKCHLKVWNNELYYLDQNLWLKSKHRLGGWRYRIRECNYMHRK